MSEQDTRRQLIDPKKRLVEVVEGSSIITTLLYHGHLLNRSRSSPLSCVDYKNKLAVVEAKKAGMSYGDAVGQVKDCNGQLKHHLLTQPMGTR